MRGKSQSFLLSPDEIARADRFRSPADAHRYTLCRSALRQLLGHYLTQSPDSLRFTYGDRGKPDLPAEPIRFNLSHSGDLALLAFARNGDLGIDLERITRIPDEDPVARMILSDAEYAHWQTHAPDDRTSLFYRYWTCKEATVKSFGGSIADVRDIEPPVTLPASDDWQPVTSPILPAPRSLLEFTPHPNYAAAVCCPPSTVTPHFLDYPHN